MGGKGSRAGHWARVASWASLLQMSHSEGSGGVGAAHFNELLRENAPCNLDIGP